MCRSRGGEFDSARHRGVLELVENFPLDQVEDAFDSVLGERFVAFGSIEQTDEDSRVSDDEHWYTPYLMRAGTASVLVTDRLERTARVDLGEDCERIDGARAQDRGKCFPISEVSTSSMAEFVQSVMDVDECMWLMIPHCDTDLKGQQARITLGSIPDIGHALLDMGLPEAEGDERDVPVGSGPQTVNDMVVGDTTVRAAIVPCQGEGSCHVRTPGVVPV